MMAVEDSMQWDDRSATGNLYMFDEIVLIDRWASHRHNPTTMSWNKMNGGESDHFHDEGPLRTALTGGVRAQTSFASSPRLETGGLRSERA